MDALANFLSSQRCDTTQINLKRGSEGHPPKPEQPLRQITKDNKRAPLPRLTKSALFREDCRSSCFISHFFKV